MSKLNFTKKRNYLSRQTDGSSHKPNSRGISVLSSISNFIVSNRRLQNDTQKKEPFSSSFTITSTYD